MQIFNLKRFLSEHLDFMNVLDLPADTFAHFRQLEHDYIGYQSLTDVPRLVDCNEELQNVMVNFFFLLHLFK